MDHLPKVGDKVVLAITIEEGSKIVTVEEGEILADATISWGSHGLVKEELLPFNVSIVFSALPGRSIKVHYAYLEPWQNCHDCECCPGVYLCGERGVLLCKNHIHKTYCCGPLGPFRKWTGEGKLTLFSPGDRITLVRKFLNFSTINTSSALNSPYRPQFLELGVVADQEFFEQAQANGMVGIPVVFDNDILRNAIMIEPSMMKKVKKVRKAGMHEDERIRIKDPKDRRLQNAVEWARTKWKNLGLCWQCQANGREGALFPEVSDPTGEGKFFHVHTACERGHYGRTLAVQVDASEFW